MKKVSRRHALLYGLFGGGLLGLRALATGLPAAFLSNPRRVLAQSPQTAAVRAAQFLVFSTSAAGDPVGCNAPGTYEHPAIMHAPGASMAPVSVGFGDRTFTAARPWGTLYDAVRQRTCFLHHATGTVVHPDEAKVLGLMGATNTSEMWLSSLAEALAPQLGTIQNLPMSVGAASASEAIRAGGNWLPMLKPTALAALLGEPQGPLASLGALREATLRRVTQTLRADASPGQSAFLDAYVLSQHQAQDLSRDLLSELADLRDDSADSQIRAAAVLIRMRLSPVVVIHLPFGGDNHVDVDLRDEARQTLAGVDSLNRLFGLLQGCGLEDKVTFALHNVFGRTMSFRQSPTPDGRDHNSHWNMGLLVGRHVRGGVIGGLQPMERDFGAMPIDSRTGEGTPGGDVDPTDSLASWGKTLGAAVGMDSDWLDEAVLGGKSIGGALKTYT